MRDLIRAIRAEIVRTRGSAASMLPWVGLVLAGISAAGILITPESQERAALLWQTLFVTGMASPLLVLLAGLTTAREDAARDGGTRWRATRPRAVVVARFLVLASLSALFHMIAFWAVIPLPLLFGELIDVAGILKAGMVCWAVTLGVLALGFVTTERWGAIPIFLVAWAWQVFGTLTAESSLWVVLPPTWAVRAMLPLLGAHQNGEPLTPADPLASESPALALALGFLLAVLALGVRLIVPQSIRSERRSDTRPVGRRSTRTSLIGAVQTVMASRPVLPLCAAAIVVGVITAIVYPNTYLTGLHTYALLPLGACIVAVLTWQTLAPGWHVLVLRRSTIPGGVQSWLILCVSIVTLVMMAAGFANAVLREHTDSATLLEFAGTGMLWLILGAAGTLSALWLTVRLGAAWALGTTVILTVLGITLGGDVLAETWLWVLGPTAWPLSADTPERFAVAIGVGVLVTVITWFGSIHALRNAPARGV